MSKTQWIIILIFLLAVIVTPVLLIVFPQWGSHTAQIDYPKTNTLVNFQQVSSWTKEDHLTFTFKEQGEYQVKFFYTEGRREKASRFSANLPEDFSIRVENGVLEKVISQPLMPAYFEITITHNGVTETHSFE